MENWFAIYFDRNDDFLGFRGPYSSEAEALEKGKDKVKFLNRVRVLAEQPMRP